MEDRTLVSTLFHLLSDEEWQALRGQMELRSFQPGEVMVAQGTMEPAFHVLIEGVASVVATNPRHERAELGRLGFGECAGEMSLLTGEPASADVIAISAVKSYAATHARLAALGELRSRLIEALSAILAGRLKHANERLLALHPARTHVICCGPEDVPALAMLPAAIQRVSSSRVMALVTGDRLLWAAARHAMQATNVTLHEISDQEVADVPRLLHRIAHECDEIVLLSEESGLHQMAPDANSLLHIARETRGTYSLPSHASGGQLIALTERPWTVPTLRELSAEFQRPVIGVLQPEPGIGASTTAVDKLARLLTNRQVGLALGAGAAKGLAHLGVLRALDDLGVEIDVISGCSIGSAIAAGYASGLTVDDLQIATDRIAAKAIRPTLPVRSFLSNRSLREELEKMAGDRRIEDLDIPLSLVATDLFRRSEVTFTTGLVWPRILASMAIPGVYPPLAAMGSFLIDGGVLNPVPVRQCRDLGAGIVIGVRLTGKSTSPREELDFTPSRPFAIETISRTLEIMHNRISEMSNVQAEVTIEVCIEGGGLRDFKRGSAIAEEGYQAVMATRDAIAFAMPYAKEAA